jgi:hypothetical protein
MRSRELNYDFGTLPQVPFSVYFYDDEGEIFPKQAYTVTRKVINPENQLIELFILEFGHFVGYDANRMAAVKNYLTVN